MITLCTLLYGDHPELARRVLNSFSLAPVGDLEVRIGLNDVSKDVEHLVIKWMDENQHRTVRVSPSRENILKYPMMRRMFYETPLTTPAVAWFDDDSWILPSVPAAWAVTVDALCKDATLIGDSSWRMRLHPSQVEFFNNWRHRRGGPILKLNHSVELVTGGFWAAPVKRLLEYDWPPKNMLHNGGDVALSVLCYQNRLNIRKFTVGVAINADDSQRCSSMPRRGVSQPPYGSTGWRTLVRQLGMDPYADV